MSETLQLKLVPTYVRRWKNVPFFQKRVKDLPWVSIYCPKDHKRLDYAAFVLPKVPEELNAKGIGSKSPGPYSQFRIALIFEIFDGMGPAWITNLQCIGPWHPIDQVGQADELAREFERERQDMHARLLEQYQELPRWMRALHLARRPRIYGWEYYTIELA